ncbi:MAG TPA: hypothetical protein PKD86_09670 [Gemmatales bacterium]|nr:hypothetical protein [Gemmatales bacterium]HMP59609.1 hypothetical protein [Gemmatales bacterium]
MLLKNSELNAIRAGEVSLVFRRWRRPSVKTGGTLKTAIGILDIVQVAPVDRSQITARAARQAGYASLADLLSYLDAHEGEIYRIEVRFAGADPRLQLREDDRLTPSELRAIQARLARLDAASRGGAWTRKFLVLIRQHPRAAAAALAQLTGHEKDWLKIQVRKLKNLGLTISHHPGYELSPRGAAVLGFLEREPGPGHPSA